MVEKRLGEFALKTPNMEAMRQFYEEVIGLEVIRAEDAFVFLKVAEGFAGHTAVIALFRGESEAEKTTVHHIAFSIALEDFEPERARLESLGLDISLSTHGWVQWRSLYVNDPDDNLVEFVAFDPSIPKE